VTGAVGSSAAVRRVGSPAAYWAAARPHTLPAAAVPVLVGTALALRDGLFAPLPALAALAGALLLQVGTNLVNDADDFERGADDARRLGPPRMVQSGLLGAAQVRRAAYLAFGAAALVGVYLIAHAGWPILLLGTASIAAGLAYTGGPWPLGYHGLGDLFVFLFFGLAAVCGTYFVQVGAVTATVVAAAAAVGALATAILVVNNLRDAETDCDAGKRTLVVLLGDRFGRAQYVALLAFAHAVPPLFWLLGTAGPGVLLGLLPLPFAFVLGRTVLAGESGGALNALLRDTARLELVFGVMFAAGLLL